MIKTAFFPSVLAIVALMAMPHAAAHSASLQSDCRAQAKAIKAGQAEAAKLKGQRDDLAAEVEAAGDEWVAAEETRLFGEAEAAKADATSKEYEALQADLARAERDLQERVSALNAAAAAYNTRCASKQ